MRRVRVWDTECNPNYWLLKFLDIETGEIATFRLRPGLALNIPQIQRIISESILVGFNSENYDVPMLTIALTGATTQDLKSWNDAIILKGVKRWEIARQFGYIPGLEHIDIMEVAPGVRISLKMYGARCHSRTLWDLPYSPDKELTLEETINVDSYCDNDLGTTADLYFQVIDRIELRRAIGAKYHINVMSKSDAQIAEQVIKAQIPFKPEVPFIPHGTQFKYVPPPPPKSVQDFPYGPTSPYPGSIPLSHLDANTLEELCVDFRIGVFKNAGVELPAYELVQAKRKPLSEETIIRLYKKIKEHLIFSNDGEIDVAVVLARAIEAAHGITDE